MNNDNASIKLFQAALVIAITGLFILPGSAGFSQIQDNDFGRSMPLGERPSMSMMTTPQDPGWNLTAPLPIHPGRRGRCSRW